jgi:drug/metabolite transporter (DMT)-like permease
MNRTVAYICLALSMTLVGSYVALSKTLVAALPVFLLAWLRFGIGTAAMLRWLKKPAFEAPMTRKTKHLLFLESFLGNFLFSICMLYGVSMTSALAAGIIMAAIPAAVALLSWAILGEKISLRIWTAIACAVLGIGLVSLSKNHGLETSTPLTSQAWLGNLFLMAAVLCESAYAVIGKQLTGVLSPKRITSLINLWGFALVTPFGLWIAWDFDFGAVHFHSWLLLVFYAMSASVWTVWLWMTGLKLVAASQAGIFTVLLPVSAAAIGVLVLGETLNATQALAFTIALTGVLLATLPAARH